MYMEGCTAPQFETSTLHSAVVELVALKGAKIQYVTVQNWSSNVFNMVTKRGLAMEDAEIRWIDCNIGSGLTMKYPAVVLKGRRARGEVISIALANTGQHQDTGAKMIHAADDTTSNIVSKSISIGEGRASYRGQVIMGKGLKGCRNNTECDALLLAANSRTDTYPAITVKGDGGTVQHEASVSQVSEEMLFTCSSGASRKLRRCLWPSMDSLTTSFRNSPWNTLWSCAGSLIWKWKTASDKEGNNEPLA